MRYQGANGWAVMEQVFAYSFDSDLNPGQVPAKLNQTGPWEWVERDNDSWGWYISAAPLRGPSPDPAREAAAGAGGA